MLLARHAFIAIATFALTATFHSPFATIQAPTQSGTTTPSPASEDIESARSELLKRWGMDGLPKPREIEATAKTLLERPLGEQRDEDLTAIAKQANAAANFVGFILAEYEDYYRDNYRYDFVQKKVAPFHDAYVTLSNDLKWFRNKAYFNLGKKALERKEDFVAFFYFRDAYRLSSFTEDEGDHKGIRYQAEIEMKRLLGVSDIESFVYWK